MSFKKYISVVVILCLLFLSACGQQSVQPDISKDVPSDKENDKEPVAPVEPAISEEPINLGIPTEEWYSHNLLARCVWDMTIHDNKLYVGCGDYVQNTGGVPVMYCALDDLGNWQREGALLDEQLSRFLILDDKLTVPGWDPKDTPEYCPYYQLENGKWQTYSVLPDGLHNFDLVRYDGKLFAGIGANKGETPIVMSENGIDFERVPMLRNGVPVDTSEGEMIRTYNLWVLNDTLYADFHYDNMVTNKWIVEVYRYENGKFIWCVGLGKKLNMVAMGSQNLGKPWADAVVDDTLFLTTGWLYKTTDMVEYTQVSFPNYAQTYDIYSYKDAMYLLTASQEITDPDTGEAVYHITVYSATTTNPDDFKVEYTVDSAVQPIALAVSDDGYFVSFGNWYSSTEEQNGTVIYYPKK